MAQVFSDLAEATVLFEEVDNLPVTEYLDMVARCYEDCSAVMAIVFSSMTDSVREKIPDEAWERHLVKMRGHQNMTSERLDQLVASVMQRLSVPTEDYDEPGDDSV
jgi:hypothetical protein